MDIKLERILNDVEKPARYIGGEVNQIIKNKDDVNIRLAFCFPDVYEIGMSNLGMSILYNTMNSLPFVWCERVFAPWSDMYEEMKNNNMPLYALESKDTLDNFDCIAFSVGYEMAYTTVLDMLRQANISIYSKDREHLTPLVIAGGTVALNPEPIADFVDIFIVGEGEEVNNELLTLLNESKLRGDTKEEFLVKASKIEGIYIPAFYTPKFNDAGVQTGYIKKYDFLPDRIKKRIIEDFDKVAYPTNPIVPSTQIVHDRINLELFRGCIRGCRFCQAGYTYRPIRSKSCETVVNQGIEALENTGYSDVTMLSLSSSDYKYIGESCDALLDFCKPRNIGISLPSLRADNFSVELMQKLQSVRKSGLTFAVEGGSQRLRDAVNKNVTEEDVLNTCKICFQGGWNRVKLYYMLGLPTENDEDIIGIARMADEILHCWRVNATSKNRGCTITISTSCFIPKPHTPFQWEAQISKEEYIRRVNILRDAITAKNVVYNWHDGETGFIEAILSRGDRRLGKVIEKVLDKGARLEAWSDYFRLDRWLEAFDELGIDPYFYTSRERQDDEYLPWDILDIGVTKQHLLKEKHLAYQSIPSLNCRQQCSGCGANKLLKETRCDV